MFGLSFLDKTWNEKLLMQSYDLEFHDYAQLFPLIVGDDYEALLEDIDTNGQLAPIVLHEGKILDGRNRYRVCQDLLIEPQTVEYTGDDALGYVLSLNLYRRQLTVAQRALIAAELSSLRGSSAIAVDVDKAAGQELEAAKMAIEEAAKVLGVSPRSVSSACKVVRDGTQELLDAVKAGEVSVSAAEQVAKLEKEAQQELCSRGPKAIRKAAKDMREEGRSKTSLFTRPIAPSEKDGHLPPPVPLDDEAAAIEQKTDAFHSLEKKPAAQLLFEMTDAGMQFGREAEGVADDIMNQVEEGLDLQFLAFVVDVAKRLENRVKAKMQARYADE
jgi:ParB-like chromosome segregation protein Spo0J